MKSKVVMIGPGSGVVGGIATVVETLRPFLVQETDFRYIPTTQNRLQKTNAGRLTGRNLLAALRQYLVFFWNLLRNRPDVVHLHTSQGGGWLKDSVFIWMTKLFRLPLIIHMHAAEFDKLYAKRPKWEQHYTRRVLEQADIVIAVSEQWRMQLSQIVPSNRIITFRNCVDVNLVSRKPGASTTIPILFLGSIGPRKGLFDLLETAAQLQAEGLDFVFWLAGYEEASGERQRAAQRIQELGIGTVCELLGVVMGDVKLERMQRAEIFVLPSYNEGLPIAVLEGMAAGLPLVVSPVGGIPEVVQEGVNGYLVAAGDVPAIAKRLGDLIRDAELRAYMGQRSREFAERELDVRPYAARLVALYKTLAAGETAVTLPHSTAAPQSIETK